MEKVNGYEEAKTYTEQEKLPVGGYILKIMKAEELVYAWGKVLLVSFDIAEGDFKDFFKNNYQNQPMEDKKWKGTVRLNVPKGDHTEKDGWTMSRFKTNMTAVEESNKDFRWEWNEKKLTGKLVGAIFNNKEYDFNGKSGFYTNCYSFVPIEKIKSGKFTIPKDTLLKNSSGEPSVMSGDLDDYEPLLADDDLPF